MGIRHLSNPMEKKHYYCPRCWNEQVVEYESSFECPSCLLEFDKSEFDSIKDKSSILSLEEKRGISEVFNQMGDPDPEPDPNQKKSDT